MDNKQLIETVANAMGQDEKTVRAMLDATVEEIAARCSDCDSVAVPNFGRFESVKHDEHVETDPMTGARTLEPPCIRVTFRPSVVLCKKLTR